jgi:hypothetical protein
MFCFLARSAAMIRSDSIWALKLTWMQSNFKPWRSVYIGNASVSEEPYKGEAFLERLAGVDSYGAVKEMPDYYRVIR